MKSEILCEGAPERAALDKIQAQVLKTKKSIEQVEAALLPHQETRALLGGAIKTRIFQRSPENKFSSFQRPGDVEAILHIDGLLDLADLAYILGPDVFLDMVMKRIEEHSGPVGLPATERAVKSRKLRDDLDKLERDEERETLNLWDQGHQVMRRVDVSRERLFEVWAEFGA